MEGVNLLPLLAIIKLGCSEIMGALFIVTNSSSASSCTSPSENPAGNLRIKLFNFSVYTISYFACSSVGQMRVLHGKAPSSFLKVTFLRFIPILQLFIDFLH